MQFLALLNFTYNVIVSAIIFLDNNAKTGERRPMCKELAIILACLLLTHITLATQAACLDLCLDPTMFSCWPCALTPA